MGRVGIILKVILSDRIYSKMWNSGNAGGEASNPTTTANFTAICLPVTLFLKSDSVP